MSKIVVALWMALSLAVAGCSSVDSSTPTGCVANYPTSGTEGDVCAVEWSCSSDAQHFQINCTLAGSNYACTCSSDTSNNGRMVVLNAFPCTLNGGAIAAAAQCGWTLQM